MKSISDRLVKPSVGIRMRDASREIVKQYKQQIIEGLCFFGILKSTYAGTAKALKRINEIRLELVDLLDEVIAE